MGQFRKILLYLSEIAPSDQVEMTNSVLKSHKILIVIKKIRTHLLFFFTACLEEDALWFVFLPCHRTGEKEVRSSWLEHPIRVQ